MTVTKGCVYKRAVCTKGLHLQAGGGAENPVTLLQESCLILWAACS